MERRLGPVGCRKHFLVIRIFVVVFRETENTVLTHLYFLLDNSEIFAIS